MRHRAIGINRGDMLKCLPRLRVGHVMEKRDASIEFHLRFFRTRDREVDRAQMMTCVTGRFVRIAGYAKIRVKNRRPRN